MTIDIGILVSGGHHFSLLHERLGAAHLIGVRFDVAIVSLQHARDAIQRTLTHWAQQHVQLLIVVSEDDGLWHYARGMTHLPVMNTRFGQPHSFDDALDLSLRILAMHSKDYEGRLAFYERANRIRIEKEAKVVREALDVLQRVHGREPSEPEPPPPTEARPDPPRPSGRTTEEDERILEEYARSFKPRILDEHPHVEAPVRPKPLDYSPALREVITAAKEIANAYGHPEVLTEHFLAAILDSPSSAAHAALQIAKTDFKELAQRLSQTFPAGSDESSTHFALSPGAVALIQRAKQLARDSKMPCLTTNDILRAMAADLESASAELLEELGASQDAIDTALGSKDLPDETEDYLRQQPRKPEPEVAADWDTSAAGQLERRLFGEQDRRAKKKEPPRTGDEKKDAAPPSKRKAPKPKKQPLGQAGEQRDGNLMRCDMYNPALETVEHASDTLLEGRIVVLPTECGYYAAVDATNEESIQRLLALKGGDPDKPTQVMIYSTSMLPSLVRGVPTDLDPVIEEFWPGPLVLVFARHPKRFHLLSNDSSLGIRMPNNYLTLGVLSMIQRPVAVVSATRKRKDSLTAQDAQKQLGDEVDLILDCGRIAPAATATVLSVVQRPYRILREGTVSTNALLNVLGEKLYND